MTTTYNLPIHKHPLFPSTRFVVDICGGCNSRGMMYDSYVCNEYSCGGIRFHKKCAEAPAEINNHPSHPQHTLQLTNDSKDSQCDFCGKHILTPYYSCMISTCDFKVHLSCGMKPPPPTIEHPVCDHDHPVVYMKHQGDLDSTCKVCCVDIIYEPYYSCTECNKTYFHVGCVNLPKELHHPCHSNHPLKLIYCQSHQRDDVDKTCLSCGEQPNKVTYHCSICNFFTCLLCIKNPPPLVIKHIKTHKHPLTCFSRRISFTCDACGMEGNVKPYICLQCDFVIHGKCIDLPRVVNINRHGHRISFTYYLGPGYSECGVCRQSISQYHGAYSCSVCPNYAVHSRCAVEEKVWDGVELEGIPEIIEDIAPFKVVGDNLISYFSHTEHLLRLYRDNIHFEELRQCGACNYPVGVDSIYVCEECPFVLHEKCANLPRKTKFVFGTAPYSMKVANIVIENCDLCLKLFDGFKYTSEGNKQVVDVHCCSLSEPFVHVGHKHPLYFVTSHHDTCSVCMETTMPFLSCKTNEFILCFYCASLPSKLRNMNDEHLLTLCCGTIAYDKYLLLTLFNRTKASDKYWCEVCEEKLDPKRWFYTCSECEVYFHVGCLLGDFSRLKLDKILEYKEIRFEVVSNNQNTRRLCIQCHSRCTKFSIILKSCVEVNVYICSPHCLNDYCFSYKLEKRMQNVCV